MTIWCWRVRTGKGFAQTPPLHIRVWMSVYWSLSLVSNLLDVHTYLQTEHLCVHQCIFLYLRPAVGVKACVCVFASRHLGASRPLLWPWSCHLSAQITHTRGPLDIGAHTHNCCDPFLELKSNRSCQPCKTCQHSKVCFLLMGVHMTRKTCCLL